MEFVLCKTEFVAGEIEFVNDDLTVDISIHEDKDRWRVSKLSTPISQLDIIPMLKNDYFISMFSHEAIDKLIEYFAREKNHEAVAIVMDYKSKKYGFRQNGEDDLL